VGEHARFFIEGSHQIGDVVTLAGADARKILVVLRMKSGETIEIVDSSGTRFSAELEVARERVRGRLDSLIERPTETKLTVALAQGIPKGQKMELVVEKATELGVMRILPFFAERTIGEHLGEAKLERWRRVARSAAQQSGRGVVPLVEAPQRFDALAALIETFDRTIVAWELAARIPLQERLPALLAGVSTVLAIVGPEGGLTHAEAQLAQAAGASVVSMGPRILRTETAGLVLCSAILYAAGEI